MAHLLLLNIQGGSQVDLDAFQTFKKEMVPDPKCSECRNGEVGRGVGNRIGNLLINCIVLVPSCPAIVWDPIVLGVVQIQNKKMVPTPIELKI